MVSVSPSLLDKKNALQVSRKWREGSKASEDRRAEGWWVLVMGCKRMSIADACRQAGGAALGMWLTLASAAVVVLTVEATVPQPSRPTSGKGSSVKKASMSIRRTPT